MTPAPDPFVDLRPVLETGVRQVVGGLPYAHAELLREHARPAESHLPALLCLHMAEVLEGDRGAVLPGATALALVAAMGRVLLYACQDNAGWADDAWGMPRTLNAGDGFCALAHSALLGAAPSATAGSLLRASASLDAGNLAFSESLYALHGAASAGHALARASRALYPAALCIGGALGGADDDTLAALGRFGEVIASGDDATGALPPMLSPAGREALRVAAEYVAGGGSA